jgi:hypothetical protein
MPSLNHNWRVHMDDVWIVILPPSPSPAALRVVRGRLGLSRALLAGIASQRWRRTAAGVAVGCSLGLVVGLVPVVGTLPGCRGPDRVAWIWDLGLLIGVLKLLRLGRRLTAATAASLNKSQASLLSDWVAPWLPHLPLAGCCV